MRKLFKSIFNIKSRYRLPLSKKCEQEAIENNLIEEAKTRLMLEQILAYSEVHIKMAQELLDRHSGNNHP